MQPERRNTENVKIAMLKTAVKLLKPPDKQAALREQQVRPEPEP